MKCDDFVTGFFTTTLVQSSSASTVLVVSFVNAGLLTLLQAIGVIMGANLGTTTTAWIVALIGKFNVAELALPLIGIGLPLFFSGRHRGRNWGEALIGFGLVFFGLGLLKDSVPDLRQPPPQRHPGMPPRTRRAHLKSPITSAFPTRIHRIP